ncbi:MAG: hypothetical protein A2Z95_05760 [Gallionellales bacterium GWA2_60_18]|nr:MAG: hypothetical protein A2Z95_05760 [Gallionellales bacterium GWA2_60_18]
MKLFEISLHVFRSQRLKFFFCPYCSLKNGIKVMLKCFYLGDFLSKHCSRKLWLCLEFRILCIRA